jgi:chemotaxis protein MotB
LSPDTWMKRTRPAEEEEDGFMVSYSALMILLLTFMILMVTLANFKEPRFRKAIGSVRGAFSFLPYAGGDNPTELGSPGFLPEEVLARATSDEQADDAYEEIVNELKAKARAGAPGLPGLVVEERDEGLAIEVSEELMFERGRAELKPDALPMMALVARAVAARPGKVSVIGNTCDLPISTAEFPSNWELSIIRAVNVVHYLERLGVSPEALFAIGLADQQPIVPNDDEQSRRRNRRVEIYIANSGDQNSTSSEVLQ